MRLRAPLYYQGQNEVGGGGWGGGGGNRVPPTGKGKAASALRKRQKLSPSNPRPLRESREAPPLKKREGLRDPEEGNGSQCSHWRKGTETM